MTVDYAKHLRSLMIGVVAAIAVVLAQWAGTVDLGPVAQPFFMAVVAMVVNAIRGWVEANGPKPPVPTPDEPTPDKVRLAA